MAVTGIGTYASYTNSYGNTQNAGNKTGRTYKNAHELLFVNLSAPDVFFFMQVKRRYRTKQSDIFFSRLFYPVPSCIISYVTIK